MMVAYVKNLGIQTSNCLEVVTMLYEISIEKNIGFQMIKETLTMLLSCFMEKKP